MTLVWDENHEEDFDWSWRDQSKSENLLAEYIEALDDAGANHALAELKITPIFVWLGRYGICTGPLCWTLLGKEVKYQEGEIPEVDPFAWDAKPEVEMEWWIDGEKIDCREFWKYLHTWILDEVVDSGIVMGTRK